MIYKVNNTYGSSLMHYGVKGMKWGKHKKIKEKTPWYASKKEKEEREEFIREAKKEQTSQKLEKKYGDKKVKKSGSGREIKQESKPVDSKTASVYMAVANKGKDSSLKVTTTSDGYETDVEQTANQYNTSAIKNKINKMKQVASENENYQFEYDYNKSSDVMTCTFTSNNPKYPSTIVYTVKNASKIVN